MEMPSPINRSLETGSEKPTRELREEEVRNLLLRNIFGRLGFRTGEEIVMVPVNFVFRDGAIFIRTGRDKIQVPLDQPVAVTFEVDEVQSNTWWRTVLVKGELRRMDPRTGEDSWVHAMGMIRRLQPDALLDADEFPKGSEVFRIQIQSITGRARG